jgi:hypothetical protein
MLEGVDEVVDAAGEGAAAVEGLVSTGLFLYRSTASAAESAGASPPPA